MSKLNLLTSSSSISQFPAVLIPLVVYPSFLQDYADEFNLVIGNTAFRKPQRKLWTFKYPDSTKAQIDFILVRKKWRNSLHNAEAYNTSSTVGSDHRIVTATIQL